MPFSHKLARRLAMNYTGAALAAALLVTGCSADKMSDATAPSIPQDAPSAGETVIITPGNITAETNQPVRFGGYTRTEEGDSTDGELVWSASGGTIAQDGTFQASAPGTYQIFLARGGIKGKPPQDTSDVVVVPPQPSLSAVVVTPDSASVASGAKLAFTASGKLSDGTTSAVGVTWTATGGTVDAGGNYTAGSTAGTYRVIATSTSGTLADTARVTVTTAPATPPTVQSIVLTPATASLQAGAAQQFAAAAKMSDGTSSNASVTWTATGGTVTAAGLYTAGTTAGTFRVIARQSSGTLADTAVVTIAGGTGTPTTPTTHSGYHVSPSGSSGNDGSAAKPWSLAHALSGASGKIQPGDTVWLHGGTYKGAFTSRLTGTSSAPVVVRQYPGERAIIDGAGSTSSTFNVSGPYSVYWGFEVTNSDPNRVSSSTSSHSRTNTVVIYASNTKFYGMSVHDGGVAFYVDPAQRNVEISGNIIYNNGWQGPDRGHGHALYLKTYSGPIIVRDNVMFNQFGYGIHAYTNAGSGSLTNIQFYGNVAFNSGTLSNNSTSPNFLVGGYEPASGIVAEGNMTYFSPGEGGTNVQMGYSSYANRDLTFRNNYITGGSSVMTVGHWDQTTVTGNLFYGTGRQTTLNDASLSSYSWSGNTYHRDAAATAWYKGSSGYTLSAWKSATGVGSGDQAVSSAPSATKVFVRPSTFEKGRGNIVVYNWGKQGSVSADLSGVLTSGDRFEVRNVQNLHGAPVASGTYSGGSVSLPMSAVQPPAPTGMSSSAAPSTGSDFAVFVVTKVEG